VRTASAGVIAFAILFSIAVLPGWRFTAKSNVRECQMEALRSFAHLREANEQGVFWPPHQLENDYISYCMSARGYRLRDEPAVTALSGERALHIANPDSWGWDLTRLLPKFVRDVMT